MPIVIGTLGAGHLLRDYLVLLGIKKYRVDNIQQGALLVLVHILRKVLSIPAQWFYANRRRHLPNVAQQTSTT